MLGDDIEVDSGGLDTGMPQELLNCAKIGALFHQGRCKEVPQPMGGEVGDPGSQGVLLDDVVELFVLYGKEPIGVSYTLVANIRLQGLNQALRQRYNSILGSLPPPHVNKIASYITQPEVRQLRYPHTGEGKQQDYEGIPLFDLRPPVGTAGDDIQNRV